MPELSVVITVLNEEKNIRPLLDQVRTALSELDYEIVLVDDGSTDATKQEILNHTDERTLLVELEKNVGQSAAMRAGIEHSSGPYIAFLDGDLQNDPADIPGMLQLVKKENVDVVAGNRKKRQDGFWLRKIPSRIANILIRYMTGVHLKDYGCTLRVFKRKYAEGLQLYGGLHRFIPVLATLQGARIIQVDVQHHARKHGESKYGLGRTFKVMEDLVLMTALRRVSVKKRRINAPVGLICFLLGLITLINLYIMNPEYTPVTEHFLYWPAIVLLIGGLLLVIARMIAAVKIKAHYRKAAVEPYTISQLYKGKQPLGPAYTNKNSGKNSAV